MPASRCGHLRITHDCFELWLLTDRGEVIDVVIELGADTAKTLRAAAARHGHARECAASGSREPLLVRSLRALGVGEPVLEVHRGQPPRFALALTGPCGRRELELDLADVAELVIGRRVPILAVGWPPRDWDAALADIDRVADHPRPDGSVDRGLGGGRPEGG